MINWELLEVAVELHKRGSDATAESVLREALKLDIPNSDAVDTPHSESKSVLYGQGGWYTDEYDPRTKTADKHSGGDGQRVTGVNVLVRTNPSSQYRAVSVETLLNDESCNVYVFENVNGAVVPAFNSRMVTGSSDGYKYDNLVEAPSSPGSFFMGRDSKFWPPAIGPIGAVIVENGKAVSDIVYGMGLSEGQHMSYRIVFERR